MSAISGSELIYFPVAGRGESIRLAFKVGGIEFTDTRVAFPQWKEMKPTTPWGAMPMLKLSDGTMIAQQRAILRMVSKHTGLYPTDPLAAAKVDELMDAVEDLQVKVNAAGQGLEQAEKEAKRKEACESGVVFDLLTKLDAYIAKNGSGGYAVGDKLTCADLMIFTTSCGIISGMFDGVPETTFDPFKNVQALRKAVANHPKVVEYHDSQKETINASFIKARDL
eukprot:CAMPEP_0181309482 /NCGR_PEP_ID=MMETSP1101-20121128/12036_1 /TAXON_ID=46948 /ORGANISM="Rhodomonas abbreviata, Strain Caron Lab Isolate" /LENGTH=223 /DNA_ID=CAMNT_0023415967 /DNA_START=19 /DNA_END=690 /DNA_ORIENTATION=-